LPLFPTTSFVPSGDQPGFSTALSALAIATRPLPSELTTIRWLGPHSLSQYPNATKASLFPSGDHVTLPAPPEPPCTILVAPVPFAFAIQMPPGPVKASLAPSGAQAGSAPSIR
jgi:hypothetical protein